MDFVVGLPWTLGKFDSIWVIVDRLTKSAHFIPIQTTYTSEKLPKIYIREILHLHRVPVSIISNRGPRFTSHFLKSLQQELGTRVELSITFHPHTDDLLRDSLDKVKIIQERLLTAQSRQKSYVDWRVHDSVFMVGDQVLLKVSPMKGVMRCGKKGELSPRYIGPFEIIQRVGDAAYELALPLGLSSVHPVFYVSMLKKYVSDGSHVIRWDSVMLDQNLSYEEEPIAILDNQIRNLTSKEIVYVKVQWSGRPVEEATWEIELDMRARYP
ncbi:uncharacterized protein LOC132043357 [Lycium ferocissimum]|uniref:uncharacterized protein LOC132043357 n=1 Tax=Lycium ferocissimum TaxID=112874 RepID=UPI00281508AA|nr:uncharacterized protein LOC132043357 [Lycium ferocissimum]